MKQEELPMVELHVGPPGTAPLPEVVPACSPELAAPAEPPLSDCEFVVVDVETTGGSVRNGHKVTEIAAIVVDGRGRVVDEFQTLVNPERPIPRFITALTNITDEMVRDAPRFCDVLPELRAFLGDRVFVAHNASFDRAFVGFEIVWASGEVYDPRTLCTVRLARRLVPEVSSRSLDALSFYFGFDNDARHRAYGDARVTALLLGRLLERLEEREISTWTGVQELLHPPRKKRPKRQATPQSMEWV